MKPAACDCERIYWPIQAALDEQRETDFERQSEWLFAQVSNHDQ